MVRSESERSAQVLRGQLLDLLSLGGPNSNHVGGTFASDAPWHVIQYGAITLRSGIWKYECDGDEAAAAAELRLFSPEDTLATFSAARGHAVHAFFHRRKTFDVSLLVTPWPGRVAFRKLQLRRLSALEAGALFLNLLQRSLKSGRPLQRLKHILLRMLAGRSLRLNTAVRPASPSSPQSDRSEAPPQFSTSSNGEITAVFRSDEQLHPRV